MPEPKERPQFRGTSSRAILMRETSPLLARRPRRARIPEAVSILLRMMIKRGIKPIDV
jgi:hypothetical protein